MASVFIVAALLERLQFLFPEGNPKRELIAKVIPVCEKLKEITEYVDAEYKLADEKPKSFGEIMRLSYKFEDLIESYKLSRRNGFLNRISRRYSRQIKVKEEELSSMIVQAYELLGIRPSEALVPRARRFLSRESIVASVENPVVASMRKDERDYLAAKLIFHDNLQLTLYSICGTGGIGKTILARRLFQQQDIKDHFEIRAWAKVTMTYHTRDILKEILSSMPETGDNRRHAMDMREEDLAELIYRSLKGRRYLILLDDVWDADAWLSIRMAFPMDDKGSRILITTRRVDTVFKMGGPDSYAHSLRLLKDAESWMLFRHASQRFYALGQYEEIGKEIVRLCSGLPFCIVLLAGIFNGIASAEEDDPSSRFKDLYESFRDHREGCYGSLLPSDIHEFCYKYLPLRLRPSLLYLANFPEDSEIEVDTLCQLLIAEGFILLKDLNFDVTMMDHAKRYLEELVQRNFVIMAKNDVLGQKRSCHIDDQTRDFCQMKGKEHGIFEIINSRDKTHQVMSPAFRRAIYLDKSCHCTNQDLYGKADYLRSLLFFDCDRTTPREIHNLDRFIMLRVLYLRGVYFKDGKLPKGVEKLVYLRYLGFRECYLTELSSHVRNMLYLQTLDLRVRNECEMTIPADTFDNLKRLKYLYFPLAYRTHNDEKLNLSRLKELEILDNFDTSLCDAVDLLGLTNLKELTVTTEGGVEEIEIILHVLDINSSNWPSTSLHIRNFDCRSKKRFSAMEEVFNSSALHALEVEGSFKKLPEFQRASSKLTVIVLNGSELDEDPMQKLQDLTDLRILILEIEAYKGERMKCSSNGFLELRFLKLSKLYNLQKWEVEKKAMPQLCTLIIEDCKKLQMLPDLQSIHSLKTLEIASMPDEFVGRIQKSDGTAGEDFDKIRFVQPNIKVDGQHVILKQRLSGTKEARGFKSGASIEDIEWAIQKEYLS